MIYKKSYPFPVGYLTITASEQHITNISFGKQSCSSENALMKKAYFQLCEYFAGKRKSFDLPIKPCGSEFQKKVWSALLTIDYAKTKTYKQIASQIGNENACRAVGMANNKNPIAIVIPCHRVIGANGKLTGYAGGLDIKSFLLDLEKSNAN